MIWSSYETFLHSSKTPKSEGPAPEPAGQTPPGSDTPANCAAAVFRSEQDLVIYLNGESVGDGNVPPSIYDSPAAFMLGAYDNGHGGPERYANARLDEVRVSSLARYTEPFQPERP